MSIDRRPVKRRNVLVVTVRRFGLAGLDKFSDENQVTPLCSYEYACLLAGNSSVFSANGTWEIHYIWHIGSLIKSLSES